MNSLVNSISKKFGDNCLIEDLKIVLDFKLNMNMMKMKIIKIMILIQNCLNMKKKIIYQNLEEQREVSLIIMNFLRKSKILLQQKIKIKKDE